jgi:hypothetical protein
VTILAPWKSNAVAAGWPPPSRGGATKTIGPISNNQRLRDRPETVGWRELYRLTEDDGSLRDLFRVRTEEQLNKEGYRLLWFHSRVKQDSDAATRTRRLQRAIRELTELRRAMQSDGIASLPLYPEVRTCVRPTTDQRLDVFEPISRHTLLKAGDVFVESVLTDFCPLHRTLLKLLRVSTTDFLK